MEDIPPFADRPYSMLGDLSEPPLAGMKRPIHGDVMPLRNGPPPMRDFDRGGPHNNMAHGPPRGDWDSGNRPHWDNDRDWDRGSDLGGDRFPSGPPRPMPSYSELGDRIVSNKDNINMNNNPPQEDQFGRQRPPPRFPGGGGRGFGGRGPGPGPGPGPFHHSMRPGGGPGYPPHGGNRFNHPDEMDSPRHASSYASIAHQLDEDANRSPFRGRYPNHGDEGNNYSGPGPAPERHRHSMNSDSGNNNTNDPQPREAPKHSNATNHSQHSTTNDPPELNQTVVDVIPPSPSCPPSPEPAAPSALAVAMARMVEMNADMEFAYAKLMMLQHEHERVEARLKVIGKLSEEKKMD
mmetsp:Transcript_5072/g.10109  ORF Transcript_5072/g.10109 Transcript_5072/m.10109 type:complete len:350 (+) Transcript_5072:590-1639(+)